MLRIRFFLAALFAGATWCVAQSAKPVEVAPGVTLPTNGDGTVYVLDQATSGPSLVHVKPHEVVLDTHAVGNFWRAQILAGGHAGAVLHTLQSEAAVASTKSVVFVHVGGETAELMKSRVHLVWLDADQGKKERVVAEFTYNSFGGHHRRNVYEVPASTEMMEGTDWMKITPNEPLSPGEFAIVFLPADVNQLPDAAYDFSIAGGAKEGGGSKYASKETGAQK